MKNTLLLNFVLLTLSITLSAQQNKLQDANRSAQQKLEHTDKQFFIENKGQWPSDVLYLTRTNGLDAWITKKGINYTFYRLDEVNQIFSEEKTTSLFGKLKHNDYQLVGHRVLMNLQGSNDHINTEGKQKQDGYYNYLIGNEASKHAINVSLYKVALVKDVYTGIDMRYYFDNGLLRYDYIVHPGANPNQIQFTFEGSDKTYLNSKGDLTFTTRFGEVRNADLYTYQQQDKKQIDAEFKKQGETFSITLGTYNTTQTLVIDPLIYSTFIGGSGSDEVYSIALDATNNAYITGLTFSANYSITAGAFQAINELNLYDAFVTKLNPTGTTLIYSTYLGGNGNDLGSGITLDASNNIYISGSTSSTNYDITQGAFQTTLGGDADVVVTKLNPSGNALIYSTYIGGSGDENSYSIALDASSNVYITGVTASLNYDVTSGAYQTAYGGGDGDAFVTKFNSSGSALIYSTYCGGSLTDYARSIVVDASNNAYIVGATSSANYDITTGAFQTTNAGGYDVFITKINPSGAGLVYSTYIGGNGDETAYSIAIDASLNAYITGETTSVNYPITIGAFQTTFAGVYDAFVTKLNNVGTTLIYSTYIGGIDDDNGQSIKLDAANNAYITGFTKSTDYDITLGAFQTTNAGGYDAVVTKLNTIGTSLIYSTYLGGSNDEFGSSISLDANFNAYILGSTSSTDYDITAGAFQTVKSNGYDVFVTKLDFTLPTNVNEIISNTLFKVFPNPSQGIYNIALHSTIINDVVLIDIFDLQGKLILSKQQFDSKSNNITINLFNDPAGVYVLKIKVNNSYEVLRLVKL